MHIMNTYTVYVYKEDYMYGIKSVVCSTKNGYTINFIIANIL